VKRSEVIPVQNMEAYKGRKRKTPLILTLILDEVEWSDSLPGGFNVEKRTPPGS